MIHNRVIVFLATIFVFSASFAKADEALIIPLDWETLVEVSEESDEISGVTIQTWKTYKDGFEQDVIVNDGDSIRLKFRECGYRPNLTRAGSVRLFLGSTQVAQLNGFELMDNRESSVDMLGSCASVQLRFPLSAITGDPKDLTVRSYSSSSDPLHDYTLSEQIEFSDFMRVWKSINTHNDELCSLERDGLPDINVRNWGDFLVTVVKQCVAGGFSSVSEIESGQPPRSPGSKSTLPH